jgi:hypothetical protein
LLTARHALALLRWLDLESGVLLVSLTAFVWVFFGTGRKWLALLGTSVMCISRSPICCLNPN